MHFFTSGPAAAKGVCGVSCARPLAPAGKWANRRRWLETRERHGIQDVPGSVPGCAIPKGDMLLITGIANLNRLSKAPVKGPPFDMAPVANECPRAHLCGDIFERDNLDWRSRRIATVTMLAALRPDACESSGGTAKQRLQLVAQEIDQHPHAPWQVLARGIQEPHGIVEMGRGHFVLGEKVHQTPLPDIGVDQPVRQEDRAQTIDG